MGFLSSIGNAISSGFSAVSNAFSTVASVASAIGSRVAEFASNIKPILGPILTTIAAVIPHPVVKAVVTCANALLHALSIFHPNENIQDMGDRALQAAEKGITMDKFEDFDDYIDALRKFELNPEASEKYGAAEKLIAGLGVATVGIEDKFNAEPGSLSNLWLLPATNPEYFTAERLKSLLENGGSIGDISAYLDKHMNGETTRQFEKKFEFTPDGKPMDNKELGELYDALDSARTEWAELNKQLKGDD